MKILVFAPYSHLHDLAALTMPNKIEYCKRHGYEFSSNWLGGEGINIEGKYSFRRMGQVVDILKSGDWDWIWVVGIDVVITNQSIKLESIIDENFGLIHSSDSLDPCLACMDSYLVSMKALPLLECVMSYWENPIGGLHEQSTTHALCQEPRFNSIRKLLPQRVMNAYDYQAPNISVYGLSGVDVFGNSGQWQPGDFVIHVAATNSTQFKIDYINTLLSGLTQ